MKRIVYRHLRKYDSPTHSTWTFNAIDSSAFVGRVLHKGGASTVVIFHHTPHHRRRSLTHTINLLNKTNWYKMQQKQEEEYERVIRRAYGEDGVFNTSPHDMHLVNEDGDLVIYERNPGKQGQQAIQKV